MYGLVVIFKQEVKQLFLLLNSILIIDHIEICGLFLKKYLTTYYIPSII